MSHLNLEVLARLVDEAPTALEAAHLAACEACRGELQRLHEQTAALAALPELAPPADEWARVERRLRNEGLIRGGRTRGGWAPVGLRAAAALALLATGTLLGRVTGAGPSAADPTAAAPAQAVPASLAEREPVAAPPSAEPQDAPGAAQWEPSQPAVQPAPALRLASTDTRPAGAGALRPPRSGEEALEQLRAAELSYLDALTRFAEFSGNTGAGDPAARLAALEGIVLTTRAALGQAPTDPVINGYHLTALAQRDATLRQIASTSSDSWF